VIKDLKQFVYACGVIGPLVMGLWTILNAINAAHSAEAAATTAIQKADQALEKTQGIDVIQLQLQHQNQELDELQQNYTILRDQLGRKLDKILEEVGK